MPDGRRPVEHGPEPDRTAVPEQVAEQVAGEPVLHVEQVPLLQHEQRDHEREPLDDAELDGFGVGGRRGHPQPPGQFAAHHDRGSPGRAGPGTSARHRHPGHRIAAPRHLLGLQRGPRGPRPPRGRSRRRAVPVGGRARQHVAVGVLHRDRRAQRRRERADQFRQASLVQHQLHQLVVLLLGPLKHGPAPAQLVVGPGQLPDDFLLLGPQPGRLQGRRGLAAEQLDELKLGPAELPRGDRIRHDDPGQVR